jgi:hypothetical protein
MEIVQQIVGYGHQTLPSSKLVVARLMPTKEAGIARADSTTYLNPLMKSLAEPS